MRTPRRFPVRLIRLLLLGALCGCSSPTAPGSDVLSVEVVPPALSLKNLVNVPVYTFIADPNYLALVDWTPCTDPAQCPSIAPGEKRSIPYTAITGYTPTTLEAIVYHWLLVPKSGGGFQPDGIRAIRVTLR